MFLLPVIARAPGTVRFSNGQGRYFQNHICSFLWEQRRIAIHAKLQAENAVQYNQVALDTKMYCIEESDSVSALLCELMKVLADKAEKNLDVIMPG